MNTLIPTFALLIISQAFATPVQTQPLKKAVNNQIKAQKVPLRNGPNTSIKQYDNCYSLIQGVWSHSPNENADFLIKGNKVIFVNHEDNTVRFRLDGKKLLFDYGQGLIVANRILKLTRDSLVLASANGEVRRLGKVK
jgi:hypothetical protein